MTITGCLLSKSTLCKASKNKCMVGKFFQEFLMFLINGERGCRLGLFMRRCFERNGSAQNGSKRSCKREAYPYLRGTVPYRTVPKSRVHSAIMPWTTRVEEKAKFSQEVATHPNISIEIF